MAAIKGYAHAGRPENFEGKKGSRKGIPNKTTVAVKQALTEAFEKLGGVEALVKFGRERPDLFYPMWVKLLPLQVSGEGGGPVVIEWRLEPHGERPDAEG